MKIFVGLVCGVLFGFGLAASGMTDTAKVRGFLDVFGNWVPDLLFVMGGAVFVTLITFHFILKLRHPILDTQFYLPNNNNIDKNLLLGSSIFGLGWGIYGYCPGPAIAALVYLQPQTLVFLASMALGMTLVSLWQQR